MDHKALLSLSALLSIMLLGACGDGEPAGSSTGAPTATAPDGVAAVAEPSSGVTRSDPADDAPVAELAAGLNGAGFALWREQPVEEDLVFSPLSIGHALLMARGAADDPTGDAIDRTFGLPDGDAAHRAWNALDRAVAAAAETEEDVTVTVADRIWPRIDVEPDQAWIDLLAAEHGATLETLDYAGATDASREVINEWVSERTEGLIPELLPTGFLTPQTLLVLTDAIYFEARWQTEFGKYEPVDGEFTRLDGSTEPVELMRELELGDRRGEGDGYVGAEIPYVGGDFSMLVLVPDEGRFEEVRNRMGPELLDEVDTGFTTGPYELLLPKWETTTDLDLIPWLEERDVAPGSYPAIHPGAFLDGAVHGADIAVDEEGTVAAAATGLAFAESGPPEPELTVAADQPFLYLIRHRPTGAVLFAGQVTDPTG